MKGTIDKRIGTNGSVSYRVRVELPADPITGKRLYRVVGTFRTKKEAQSELSQAVAKVDRGTFIDATKMTIAELLTFWLDQHRHNIRPATNQQYTNLVNAHLIPSLGSVALQKLSPAHLAAMYAEKRVSGRRIGTGGLAPRTVRHLHVVMHEALDFAVKMQLVSRNVTDAVDAPRFSRKEMTTWTPEHIRMFLVTAAGDTYSPIWILYVTTGLRRGEALGLRWRDVDFATGRLQVAQSVVDVGGHVHIQEPKTNAARRSVHLSPACMDALAEHRNRQPRRLPTEPNHDLIFTTGDGKPIQPRVLARAFDVLQAKAKVPRIRLHDLRHTHASLLFNDGKNIKMISQRLGHSDVGITLSVYAHLAHDAQDEAADSIDGLIFGDDPKASASKARPNRSA